MRRTLSSGFLGNPPRRRSIDPAFKLPFVRRAVFTEHHPDEEVDFGAGTAADPVPLEGLDTVGPVEVVEVLFEPVGVGGNPEHPLPQREPDDGMPAALAHAADNLLVCQDGPQLGTPVDRGLQLIGQPVFVLILGDRRIPFSGNILGNRQFRNGAALMLSLVVPGIEQNEEDELRPAEVVDVGRGQFAVPVVAETEHLELAAEVVDVLLGRNPGVRPRLLGVLFGGESEGVPTHRMDDTRPSHPPVAADDIGRRISFRVSHVQAVSAGIGEHIEDVELFVLGEPGGLEGLISFPEGLPFGFDNGRIVARHGILGFGGRVAVRRNCLLNI